MQKVNLSDWKLLSSRVASKSYISPDESKFLKFYFNLNDSERRLIEEEVEYSDMVRSLGISTPRVYGLVEIDGGGYGALFENIKDKTSLSRAISRDMSLADEYMRKFATLSRQFHSTSCDTSKARSFEAVLLEKLNLVQSYNEEEKQIVRDYIAKIPKTDTCLHGDFHPGNFITDGEKDYVIDLGNFTYGNPVYDWALWYEVSHIMSDTRTDEIFHMSKKDIEECWKLSAKYYFGYETEEEIKSLEERLEPFLAFIGVMVIDVVPENIERELKVQRINNSLFKSKEAL